MDTDFEQLVGMTHNELETILSNKNIRPGEARALEQAATRLVDSLEDEVWTLTEGNLRVPNEIDTIVRKQANLVDKLTLQLQNKEIDLAAFNKKMHDSTVKNFKKAYKKGIGRALDAGDREWLRRATQAEVGFARNFADQIEKGTLRMPRKARAQMYGSAARGAYWNGNVEKQEDDVRIFWRTTVAKHCDDCLTLECFLNDRLQITTKRGMISLKDVIIGDHVKTHRGQWKKVIAKPVHKSSERHRYAVLVSQDRLIGITADHNLWTSGGWKSAKEVFYEDDRCLQEVQQKEGKEYSGTLQILCANNTWRKIGSQNRSIIRKSQTRRFQIQQEKGPVLCKVLERQEMDNCLATPVGLGNGEWQNSKRPCDTPQRRTQVERPNRKFANVKISDTPQTPFTERREKSVLDGCQKRIDLFGLQKEVQVVSAQRCRDIVLFSRMFSSTSIRKSNGRYDMRKLRKEKTSKARTNYKKESRSYVLLSEMLSRMAVEGSDINDSAVRLLREEFQDNNIPDQKLEIGQVLLLSKVLPVDTPLFDLTVEDDKSFIVEGLVVHNSQNPYSKFDLPTTPGAGATQCRGRCKCYLEYRTGKKKKAERKAAKEGARKKEGLSLFTSFGPPPHGLRLPSVGERMHIDDLRAKINFNRRKMAQPGLSEEEMKDAILARKAANVELIEFTEQNSIWEVPIWSVDEVIDSSHIGMGAESEIFSAGIDSQTLDLLTPKQLEDILEKFGDDASETIFGMSKKMTVSEAHPDQVDFKPTKKFIKELFLRLEGDFSEYSLVANGLAQTFQLMKKVLAAAKGRNVAIGPLSLGDEMLARVYVWVRGPTEDVEKVLKAVKGIEFIATPVKIPRRK